MMAENVADVIEGDVTGVTVLGELRLRKITEKGCQFAISEEKKKFEKKQRKVTQLERQVMLALGEKRMKDVKEFRKEMRCVMNELRDVAMKLNNLEPDDKGFIDMMQSIEKSVIETEDAVDREGERESVNMERNKNTSRSMSGKSKRSRAWTKSSSSSMGMMLMKLAEAEATARQKEIETEYLEKLFENKRQPEILANQEKLLLVKQEMEESKVTANVFKKYLEVDDDREDDVNDTASYVDKLCRDFQHQTWNMGEDAVRDLNGNADGDLHGNADRDVDRNHSGIADGREMLKNHHGMNVNAKEFNPSKMDEHQRVDTMATDLITMMMEQSAPDLEVEVFTGDPLEYRKFITTFENSVERVVKSSSGRLNRLIKFTDGIAKAIIDDL